MSVPKRIVAVNIAITFWNSKLMEIYIKRPLLLHTKYVTVQHKITTGNLKIAGTRKTNSS